MEAEGAVSCTLLYLPGSCCVMGINVAVMEELEMTLWHPGVALAEGSLLYLVLVSHEGCSQEHRGAWGGSGRPSHSSSLAFTPVRLPGPKEVLALVP